MFYCSPYYDILLHTFICFREEQKTKLPLGSSKVFVFGHGRKIYKLKEKMAR